MTRRIVVVTAGLSTPSSTRLLADQLTAAVRSRMGARGESVDVEVLELRELAIALAQTLTTGGLGSPSIDRAKRLVSEADGLIAITPVFAASYSGLFKMFFDVLDPDALNGMPVIIAATAGTARHSLVLDYALRPLFTYLRAVVVPTGVFAATEDFGGSSGLDERVGRAADEFVAQLVSDEGAVGGFVPNRRDRSAGVDVPGEVTPFSALLRGHTG